MPGEEGERGGRPRSLGLRARLLLWGALLVVVTVASGYGSAIAFARVSRAMGDALVDDREASLLVQTLTSALEDEDDALLLSLAGEAARARDDLGVERRRFDDAAAALAARTSDPEERASIGAIARAVAAYRASGDRLMALEGGGEARDLYRRELAPLLRQATGECAKLREHRFRATQAVAASARDEAARATVLVSIASIAAVLLLAFVAWRLARTVVAPLRALTASVEAVRLRDFDARVDPGSDDEIGRLGAGFNRMTEALSEFNASRLGDVLAANQTLEATLEALPEAVLVVDASGGVVRTNARARALLGEVATLSEVPLPAAAAAALRDAAAGASPKNPSRADLGRAMTLRTDGQGHLFLPQIVAVPSARGERRCVLVLDEVTEFARLDEARTEFIAAAAHELRTPLTTLRMTLALLEEAGSVLTEHQRETLATARFGCEQLAATVDAFLDVTRAATGGLVVARDRVDVRLLVEQVTRGLRARFEEQTIALELDVAEGDLVVTGDRARIAAALSNLLTNALKYSPSGGRVRVRVAREGGVARFLVDDDGPGVPPELRERVFEKYFRVEQVRAEHGERARGAGIGLYLCRQIVEAHAGAVRCDAAPSGGARFVVELPAA